MKSVLQPSEWLALILSSPKLLLNELKSKLIPKRMLNSFLNHLPQQTSPLVVEIKRSKTMHNSNTFNKRLSLKTSFKNSTKFQALSSAFNH